MQRQDLHGARVRRKLDATMPQALRKLAASQDAEHAACARAVLRALQDKARENDAVGRRLSGSSPSS